MKSLQAITKLSRIVTLIRDPTFKSTQTAIAADLKCSERTVRSYFEVLTEDLQAPLINHGRNGWELGENWDLGVALQSYFEHTRR